MVCVLVGAWSWRFWTGDGGGAGGNAGERDGGGLDVVDVVIKLSDWGLDDKEEFVVAAGTIVPARFHAVKRPLLSRFMYLLRVVLRVLGEAVARRFWLYFIGKLIVLILRVLVLRVLVLWVLVLVLWFLLKDAVQSFLSSPRWRCRRSLPPGYCICLSCPDP